MINIVRSPGAGMPSRPVARWRVGWTSSRCHRRPRNLVPVGVAGPEGPILSFGVARKIIPTNSPGAPTHKIVMSPKVGNHWAATEKPERIPRLLFRDIPNCHPKPLIWKRTPPMGGGTRSRGAPRCQRIKRGLHIYSEACTFIGRASGSFMCKAITATLRALAPLPSIPSLIQLRRHSARRSISEMQSLLLT